MGAGHTGTADAVCSISATNPCTGNINTRSKDVHTRSVVGKVRSLVVNIGGTNSYSLLNENKNDFINVKQPTDVFRYHIWYIIVQDVDIFQPHCI